jgi:hypothetical protein
MPRQNDSRKAKQLRCLNYPIISCLIIPFPAALHLFFSASYKLALADIFRIRKVFLLRITKELTNHVPYNPASEKGKEIKCVING